MYRPVGNAPKPPAAEGDLRRRLIWIVVTGAVVTTVLILTGALVHNIAINLVAGVAITAAILVATWMVSAHGSIVRGAFWYTPSSDEHAVAGGLDHRVYNLRRQVRSAVERDGGSGARLYAVIEDLVRHRLDRNHDIDLYAQPQEAQRILGPELLSYLAAGPRPSRRTSLRTLDAAITRLEEL